MVQHTKAHAMGGILSAEAMVLAITLQASSIAEVFPQPGNLCRGFKLWSTMVNTKHHCVQLNKRLNLKKTLTIAVHTIPPNCRRNAIGAFCRIGFPRGKLCPMRIFFFSLNSFQGAFQSFPFSPSNLPLSRRSNCLLGMESLLPSSQFWVPVIM